MPSSTKPPDNHKEQETLRVRLIIEADVDDCADDALRRSFGAGRVHQCVRQAVENALQAAHQNGFDHDLCEEIAIFIAAVHLLKEYSSINCVDVDKQESSTEIQATVSIHID